MHAANLDLPPHIVRQTEDVDLYLLPLARAKIREMKRITNRFKPALDVEIELEDEEEDEGLWC